MPGLEPIFLGQDIASRLDKLYYGALGLVGLGFFFMVLGIVFMVVRMRKIRKRRSRPAQA